MKGEGWGIDNGGEWSKGKGRQKRLKGMIEKEGEIRGRYKRWGEWRNDEGWN